ncbi:MAG: hypothetical protein K8R90_11720 [Candidatus Cloacimonetes bacterium]|nr:hypothetical protein [Candidatus Cloacimonadota bacterium]
MRNTLYSLFLLILIAFTGCSTSNVQSDIELIKPGFKNRTLLIFPIADNAITFKGGYVPNEYYALGSFPESAIRDSMMQTMMTFLEKIDPKIGLLDSIPSFPISSYNDTTKFKSIHLPIYIPNGLPISLSNSLDVDFENYHTEGRDINDVFYYPMNELLINHGYQPDVVLVFNKIKFFYYKANARVTGTFAKPAYLLRLGLSARFIVWDYNQQAPIAWGDIFLDGSLNEATYRNMVIAALYKLKIFSNIAPP